MARVDFYHLTRDPAPPVLARLADRVLAGGDALCIVASDPVERAAIDAGLWSAIAESFLPHPPVDDALTGQSDDPIIIIEKLDGPAPNGATMLALTGGLWDDAALDFQRTFFLFDAQQIDDARSAWRTLSKREGIECHYWKQDDGGRWREGP